MRTRHEVYHQVSNRMSVLPIRTERYEGQEHIVAPVIILTEGVHNGSNGPLYYPLEELARIPVAWNGVPVVVQHPQEGSANSPTVIDRDGVGRLFNVQFENNRLRGEIWINKNKCQAQHPEILHHLTSNTPLEVSTGLFTEDEAISGVWNDEEYVAIARAFRPDHLALLPGGTGACSWEDGCGVRANKKGDEGMSKYQPAVNLVGNEEDLRQRVDKVRMAVDSLDTGNVLNYVVAVYEDSVVYEVVPHGQNNPVQRGYYKRNYSMDDTGNVMLGNEVEQVVEQRSFESISNEENRPNGDGTEPGCGCGEAATPSSNSNEEGGNEMAKNTPERKAKVDALLAANAGFAETDRDLLENMECDTFAAIEALAARPQEAAKDGAPAIIDNEDALLAAVSPELKAKVQLGFDTYATARTEAVGSIKANASNPFTDEQLEGKDLAELQALARLASAAPVATANEGNQDEGTSFAANAGNEPPAAATGNEQATVEPLGVPTMNWGNDGSK